MTLTFFKGKDGNKLILRNPWKPPLQITTKVSLWQKAKFAPKLHNNSGWSVFENCLSVCICVCTASNVHETAFVTVRSLRKASRLTGAVHGVTGLPWALFRLRTRVNSPAQHAKPDCAKIADVPNLQKSTKHHP